MDSLDLSTLIATLVDYVLVVGREVNALPGGLAFALGLVTWFLVEQILRRILSWMRWLVLVGVVVGLGYTLPFLLGEIWSRAGMPAFGGTRMDPEDVLPPSNPEL